LVDANGDGLVYLVRNHMPRQNGGGGGQLLINNGSKWVDPQGVTGWQVAVSGNPVPVVPDDRLLKNGSTFVDLNGDGLPDLVQEGLLGGTPSRAWLNRFQQPVILNFSNGLASATNVTYQVITTEAARTSSPPTYTDSGFALPGMRLLSVPLRVVSSVSEDNGEGGGRTTYQYSNLRASAYGYGPQGFEQMIATDSTGMVTTTQFAQAYPYTGLPLSVSRENQWPVASTTTRYCTRNIDLTTSGIDQCLEHPAFPARYPTQTSFFVRPVQVTDTTYLRTSTFPGPISASITTTSTFQYDDLGNSTITTVDTQGIGEEYQPPLFTQRVRCA
jgi:hypothetical protein